MDWVPLCSAPSQSLHELGPWVQILLSNFSYRCTSQVRRHLYWTFQASRLYHFPGQSNLTTLKAFLHTIYLNESKVAPLHSCEATSKSSGREMPRRRKMTKSPRKITVTHYAFTLHTCCNFLVLDFS